MAAGSWCIAEVGEEEGHSVWLFLIAEVINLLHDHEGIRTLVRGNNLRIVALLLHRCLLSFAALLPHQVSYNRSMHRIVIN